MTVCQLVVKSQSGSACSVCSVLRHNGGWFYDAAFLGPWEGAVVRGGIMGGWGLPHLVNVPRMPCGLGLKCQPALDALAFCCGGGRKLPAVLQHQQFARPVVQNGEVRYHVGGAKG